MQFFLVNSAKFMLHSNGVCRVAVHPCLQSPYEPDDFSSPEGFDARRVKNPELCIELFKKFWSRALLQKLDIHFIAPPAGAPVKKQKKVLSSDAGSSSADDGNGGLIGIPNCTVTDALMDVFGEDVCIEVQITNLFHDDSAHKFDEDELYLEMPLRKGDKYACVHNKFPTDIFELCYYLEECREEREQEEVDGEELSTSDLDYGVSGKITVSVIAKNIGRNRKPSPAAESQDKMSICKKILQEELASDLVIVPGKGNPIRGHQNFLAAHSTVFKVMFQEKEDQAKALTLEMKEMSEESVRALLAYLYYWDETEANSKPVVACDLLIAGRKYEIPALEAAMKKLLLSKEDKWFNDVDVVLKLWLFAVVEDQLKIKAAHVLKANFRLAVIEASATFQQIVKENPEASTVLELRKMFAEETNPVMKETETPLGNIT